jgi:predicted RNA-binding Zn ribbon-like protein
MVMQLPSLEEQLEPKPAPPRLRPLQAFVNTRDLDEGWDLLSELRTARGWLRREGLLGAEAAFDEAALIELRRVREALCSLLRHNNGGPAPTPRDLEPLRRLAASSRPRLRVDREGRFELGALSGGGLREGLVGLLVAARDAQADGSWSRLKVCRNDECAWAFFDRSRNRQGSWCDMAVCGNRLKNRSYRYRHRPGERPRGSSWRQGENPLTANAPRG